ncbi:MAG TPA: ABC transporter ATP-binding protein [Psychromonas sp.]
MSLIIESLNHQITDGNNTRSLLSNIYLSVSAGECVALMGDSGCGKTTLLNLIAGLEPIQHGNIKIADLQLAQATDKALSELRKKYLGIIFQQYNLLSCLSVRDNIEFSARLAGRYDPLLCNKLINQLDILSLLDHYPATLSGGEIQRVAIARALAAQPHLLLADEPTGNLDQHNSDCVVRLLVELAKFHNSALLLVTHSAHVARKMDKTYRLTEGKLALVERAV